MSSGGSSRLRCSAPCSSRTCGVLHHEVDKEVTQHSRPTRRDDVLPPAEHDRQKAQDADELLDETLDLLGICCAGGQIIGQGRVKVVQVDERRQRKLGSPAQAGRGHHEEVAPEPVLGDGADQSLDASRRPPEHHGRDVVQEDTPAGDEALLRLGLYYGD